MLKPATPLSVLLFAAFGLMLISVLSAPIIPSIPLAEFENKAYGVFGTCEGESCTDFQLGYDVVTGFEPGDWTLPASARETLPTLLIVHPVAAFLTLVLFVMAVAAHIRAASHSSRYLLLLFIFSIVVLLVDIMAFLVDVLLFNPHMSFGSYFVLAATIAVAVAGVVSCVMRRTVVGRKERRRQIEQNAEMSGENYYNREAASKAAAAARQAAQPSMPVMSGGNSSPETLPTFVTLAERKKEDEISDERVPLTQRSPSERSPNNPNADVDMQNGAAYGMAPRRSRSRDQYGNPPNAPEYGMQRTPSYEQMGMRGRGAPRGMGPRGRGGYGPPRGGPYGGPPPGRGGYAPRGYGGPPRGYPPRGGYRGGGGPPPGGDRGGYYGGGGGYSRPGSAGGYRDPYGRVPQDYPPSNASMPNVSQASGNSGWDQYYGETGDLPRAESPPPLPGSGASGQPAAVEMDANTPTDQPAGYQAFRDSDADVAGMVGLQQARAARPDTYASEASKYSADEQYVPPRRDWSNSPRAPSPLNVSKAAELPAQRANDSRTSNYYEDIDPRFAAESPRTPNPPGVPQGGYDAVPPTGTSRTMSPAESERSTYTSISQRGINPQWEPNPPPPPMPLPMAPGGQGVQRRPIPQRAPQPPRGQAMMLNDNPDFELRGGGRPQGPAYPGGMR